MGHDLVKELSAEIARLKGRPEALEDDPWLHPKDFMALLGVSKATFYRWLKSGLLPRPVRINGPLWKRSDLSRIKRRKS